MSSKTCQGLVIREGDGGSLKLQKDSVPVPKPGPQQALVRVSHVAQNPTDILSFDGKAFGGGAILGCDFVGTVEELGSEAKRLSKGDVIAGLIWGGEIKGLGGYSSATALLALFSKDCLSIDRHNASGQSVLIWGGSSSVGLYAIQIATLYGLDVITTCSPRHFDLVRAHGAKHVFDYRGQKVIENIGTVGLGLRYVFDTIGRPTTSATASQAIQSEGGVLCTVRPGKVHTENVAKQTKITDVLVWTAFLKDHYYGKFHWPPHPEDHEMCTEFFEKLPSWLESGKIKPNTPKVFDGGLDVVPEGFQEYRDGKISGYKIVYKLKA
ncbi:hypothetical protein FQN54_006294 [Arachnomyces sp. PD_36]|nr:hypothetical protein FQN54_006294 [Arachnomyces sp. PD_36]